MDLEPGGEGGGISNLPFRHYETADAAEAAEGTCAAAATGVSREIVFYFFKMY